MSRIAIVFATIDGQTEKIARFMTDQLRHAGHEASLHEVGLAPSGLFWDEVDRIILGAPVHLGHHPRRFRSFVKQFREKLRQKPTALFSVSLAAAPGYATERKSPTEDPHDYVRALCEETDWWPQSVALVGGALRYQNYGFVKRKVMETIARTSGGATDTSENHEYTDWDAVERFAVEFVNDSVTAEFAPMAVSPRMRFLDDTLPEYDERIMHESFVAQPPYAVWEALSHTETRDMRLGSALVTLRTLGRSLLPRKKTGSTRFLEGAQDFGAVPLHKDPPHELAAGLIGRFWELNFGVKEIASTEEFHAFAEPGFAKVVTNFYLEEREGGTRLSTETRIATTDDAARRNFARYWFVFGAGISLYMRSFLAAVGRKATQEERARKEAEPREPRRIPHAG